MKIRCLISVVIGMICALSLGSTLKAQYVSTYFMGNLPNETGMGQSVAAAGDVNADGFDDLIFSAPGGATTNNGRVFVVSGLNGTSLYTLTGPQQSMFGSVVSGAGDFDNDGFDDFMATDRVAISGAGSASRVRVLSGATGLVIASFEDPTGSINFGASISCAGDVNRDGHSDIIIGVPQSSGGIAPARAIVYSGATHLPLHVFDGSFLGQTFGSVVAGAGDVNSDGYDDVIVSAPTTQFSGPNPGVVIVYSGFSGTALFVRSGTPGTEYGISVDGAGDVDRDGFADFIVGARTGGAVGEGAVYVYSGRTGNEIHEILGSVPSEGLGHVVNGCGDTNGDGHGDILVVTRGVLPAGNPTITAYSGKDASVIFSRSGANGAGEGQLACGAGDANGDGFPDIAIANGTAGPASSVRLFTAPTLPSLSYETTLTRTDFLLDWVPTGGVAQSNTGVLEGRGASPNGNGFYAVSLAPADGLLFGFPMLVAVDSVNLIDFGPFQFDNTGSFTSPTITRQHPAIAGSNVYIQWYEQAPLIMSSNGIELKIVL